MLSSYLRFFLACISTDTTGALLPRRVFLQSSDVSGKFSGLHNYKRSSQDAGVAERKASSADAVPGTTGILGGMWNSFTKGSKS